MEYSEMNGLGEFPSFSREQAIEITEHVRLRGDHEGSLLMFDGYTAGEEWAVEALARFVEKMSLL